MAESHGRTAVISLCRLASCADPQARRLRTLKEAVHELGHILGLAHCPDAGCVMHFSNALADTDRKGSSLLRCASAGSMRIASAGPHERPMARGRAVYLPTCRGL